MAKQGDSDAHDACCRLSEPTAVMERGLLGWEDPAAKAIVCWRCKMQDARFKIHGPVRPQNLATRVCILPYLSYFTFFPAV